MLMSTDKSQNYYNRYRAINDYCKKSTLDSIKRIVDNYSLERNKPKFKISIKSTNNPDRDDNNDNPDRDDDNDNDDNSKPKSLLNLYNFLGILSFSTIAFLIYKRNK